MDQTLNQDPKPNKTELHPMVVLQPGERIICEIKRHPFGILSMYFSGGLAIVIAIVLAALAPQIAESMSYSGDNIMMMATLGAGIVTIGVACMLWIATTIYWQNRWIVTDDSITQIVQDGLFGRRVSQLSMENLEDVTVDQQGFLPSMFNFGTLKAETAGERSKFVFPMCPNPNAYARKILEVHEAFLHQVRHQPQQVHPVTPMTHPNDVQNHQQPTQVQPMAPQPQQQWPQYPTPPAQPFDPNQPQQVPPQAPVQPQQNPQQPQTTDPAIWGKN
jgi:hypothetical protein